MALTQATKTELYRFFAIAFDAAPGVTYMNQLAEAIDHGSSVLDVVETFTSKPQFTSVYPTWFGNDQFAAKLVENVVGDSASDAAKAEAIADIEAALNGNSTRGEVVYQIFTNLANKDPLDPVWGGTARLLANQVAVAQYYTEVLMGDTTDLATLRAVIAKVDVDTDVSTPEAIAALLAPEPPPVVNETFTLTVNQDVVNGGAGNDTFLATGATLQLGDKIFGGAGDDVLEISVSGSGTGVFDGFDTDSVELIRVKSLSQDPSLIDLSGTRGVTTLESFEVDGAALTFRDIQDVNGTALRIIDTHEDHTFVYDLNAYTPGAVATVDLTLQEIRDDEGFFFDWQNLVGADIRLMNRDGSESNVETLNLHSQARAGAGPTPATSNYVQSLWVGGDFNTLNIDGDADLEIENRLDRNLNLVDASALAADLTLDLHIQGLARNLDGTVNAANTTVLTVFGAQGDDNIDIGGLLPFSFQSFGGITVVDLGTGDDSLVLGDTVPLQGHASIDAGEGNDRVFVNQTGLLTVDLGDGNDALTIFGDVDNLTTLAVGDGRSDIVAGDGNDSVFIDGDGAYAIDLGNGDDRLTRFGDGNIAVAAGMGDDAVLLVGDGNNTVDGGEGDDSVTILGDGNQNVDVGAGDDLVLIVGDRDQTVVAAEGDDAVTIEGDGVHNIDLGAGDDYLLIDGARLITGNIDNTIEDRMTVIVGGEGNDRVIVTGDHYLDVDLGAGSDHLTLRAQDLTTDDRIIGGDGAGDVDTLRLTNQASSLDVVVGRSETDSTMGIETFELRDTNITLELSNENFDTAQERAITVNTRNEGTWEIPQPTGGVPLVQGMTVQQFVDAATASGRTVEELVDWLIVEGVTGVDFSDVTGDGDSLVYRSVNDLFAGINEYGNAQSSAHDLTDRVFFEYNPAGYQAVDITAVNLSLVSGRTFKLEGGNLRDIVIADEDSINGRSVLEFDGPGSSTQSVEDTLIVDGSANLTAADLRNVSGLEIILPAGTSSSTIA